MNYNYEIVFWGKFFLKVEKKYSRRLFYFEQFGQNNEAIVASNYSFN